MQGRGKEADECKEYEVTNDETMNKMTAAKKGWWQIGAPATSWQDGKVK
jgi:hypothetical protein